MDSFLSFLGMIIVAIISLIGIIIQTKSHNKLQKQSDIVKTMDAKLDKLRAEAKKDDFNLNKKLDENKMNDLKRFLIIEMTKIDQGIYQATDNQKRMLKEAKDEYNRAGGDSYVDDMYDKLKDKNLL
ncbi:MAG: hypothetical protein PUJ51_10620 [Clostridiales bacterium]|nr:hypothetical protein [Clostridiales bacterium]